MKAKSTEKEKKVKRKITKITPALCIAVCFDYYKSRMSISSIQHKHGICWDTARKILDTTPVPNWDVPFDPNPVKERATKDPLTRTIEVKKDAQSTVEITLATINYLVQQNMNRIVDADPNFPPKLSMKELTDFFEKAAPYVLKKVDAPKKAPSEKDATSQTKKTHDMFKKEAQNQAIQAKA